MRIHLSLEVQEEVLMDKNRDEDGAGRREDVDEGTKISQRPAKADGHSPAELEGRRVCHGLKLDEDVN